eukprot:6668407-Pyramimonas_sp.AAC.1
MNALGPAALRLLMRVAERLPVVPLWVVAVVCSLPSQLRVGGRSEHEPAPAGVGLRRRRELSCG